MKRAAVIAALSAAILIVAGFSLLIFFKPGKNPPQSLTTTGNDINSLENVTEAAKFGSVTNLTENPDDSVYGQVAADGDSVYMAWQESTGGRNYDIFIKNSRDKGDTFENNTVNLSNNAGFSEHPQLAVSGGDVYVAWTDDSSGIREIMFAKNADGASYGEPTVLSNPGNSYNVELAAFDSDVYLVWQTDGSIIFRASHDGGETFGAPVAIAGSANSESFPKVSAYGDAVHVVWSVNAPESALFHVKSSDGGFTFSKAVKLNGDRDVGEAQVVAYKDDVHIVWGGLHGGKEVDKLYYARSTDGGDTFAGAVPIGIKSPLNVELAVMPLGKDQFAVHVASQVALTSENHEIALTSSMDGGRTFSKPANLSNNEGISECPTISTTGGEIFVSWEDLTTGNHEILYAKGGL